MVFAFSDVSASQPTRALAQPENLCDQLRDFSSLVITYSLIFPHGRGPEPRVGHSGLLSTRACCVNLLQLWRSWNPAALSVLE